MIRHSHFGGNSKQWIQLIYFQSFWNLSLCNDVQSWLVFFLLDDFFNILSLPLRSAHVFVLKWGYFTLEWWLDSKSAILKNDSPGPLSVCDQAWYQLDSFNQISMYSKCIFLILLCSLPLDFFFLTVSCGDSHILASILWMMVKDCCYLKC